MQRAYFACGRGAGCYIYGITLENAAVAIDALRLDEHGYRRARSAAAARTATAPSNVHLRTVAWSTAHASGFRSNLARSCAWRARFTETVAWVCVKLLS